MSRNRLIAWLLAALASLGVAVVVVGGPAPRPSPTPSFTPSPSASSACTPTDQVAFIYHPDRLKVLAPCIRAEGTIAAIRHEADGDLHILLALDPAFASLVNPANSGVELGDLVVEPVCERAVTQADAIAICATDKDPLDVSALVVGEHVWMTGRSVTDTDHGNWAELHPLFAFGALP